MERQELLDLVERLKQENTEMNSWKLRAYAAEAYLRVCRKSLEIENSTDKELIAMSKMLIEIGQEPLMAAVCDAELVYRSFLRNVI